MNQTAIDLEKNSLSYTELRCVLGAYLRPNILDTMSWSSVAQEIVNCCSSLCIDKLLHQLDSILNDQSITDDQLRTWVQRYATLWSPEHSTDARTLLQALRDHLRDSLQAG